MVALAFFAQISLKKHNIFFDLINFVFKTIKKSLGTEVDATLVVQNLSLARSKSRFKIGNIKQYYGRLKSMRRSDTKRGNIFAGIVEKTGFFLMMQ